MTKSKAKKLAKKIDIIIMGITIEPDSCTYCGRKADWDCEGMIECGENQKICNPCLKFGVIL